MRLRPVVGLLLVGLVAGCAIGFPAEKKGLSINGGQIVAHRSIPLANNKFRFETEEFTCVYPSPWRTIDLDLSLFGITGVLSLAHGSSSDESTIDGDKSSDFLAGSIEGWPNVIRSGGDLDVVSELITVGGLPAVRIDSRHPDGIASAEPTVAPDPAISPDARPSVYATPRPKRYIPMRAIHMKHGSTVWDFKLRARDPNADVAQAKADFDAIIASLVWQEAAPTATTTVQTATPQPSASPTR